MDKVDPERREARIQKREEKAEKTSQASQTPLEEEIPVRKETPNPSNPKNPRYISPSIHRQIFLRDQGRCKFQDPVSGRICGSRFQVEIEHMKPISLGGSSEPSNLKILCRNHNLWEGIEKLGKATMAPNIRVR